MTPANRIKVDLQQAQTQGEEGPVKARRDEEPRGQRQSSGSDQAQQHKIHCALFGGDDSSCLHNK